MEWYKQNPDGVRKMFKKGMAEYYRDTYGKQYYEDNKDCIKAYHKKVYHEEIKFIKVTCGCGSTVIKHGIKSHYKTYKHQSWQSKQ